LGKFGDEYAIAEDGLGLGDDGCGGLLLDLEKICVGIAVLVLIFDIEPVVVDVPGCHHGTGYSPDELRHAATAHVGGDFEDGLLQIVVANVE
jgi:hypothetical protein